MNGYLFSFVFISLLDFMGNRHCQGSIWAVKRFMGFDTHQYFWFNLSSYLRDMMAKEIVFIVLEIKLQPGKLTVIHHYWTDLILYFLPFASNLFGL